MQALSSRFFGIVAVVLLAVAGTPPADAGNGDLAVSTPRLTTDGAGGWSFTGGGQMTGKELGTMIEKEIGAGNYQLVTAVINTCHSGAGIGALKAALSGPHNIVTTCNGDQTTRVRKEADGKLTGFLPAFWDSVNADPTKSVDSHVEEGKKGEPRLPKSAEDEAKAKARYEAYRNYLKRLNEKRAKEGKPAVEIPPEWDKGGRETRVQEPQNDQSADKPGAAKLASGKSSNHAIIYRTDGRDVSAEEEKKTVDALKKAGFTSIDILTPLSNTDGKELSDAQKEHRPPNLRDDLAIPSNLQKKLQALKPKMNKDEHLTVVVIGHGSKVQASNTTGANLGLGNGALFTQANPTDRIGGHGTASLLAEEAVSPLTGLLLDDYIYTRWDQPALVLQTLDEFSLGGAPVGVLINGIPVGDLVLDDEPPGGFGFHRLEIDDAAIAAIFDTTDILNGLEVSFDFSSPDDFLKLATADDLELMGGVMGFYGLSLQFSLDGDDAAVPEPGTLALLVVGLAWLVTARRRRPRP
ncbi:MAG: PEP-CTERM sorting domain-containing protein [Hyphomicrobiales bacterium]|nr:PEP-CTERM sorting domain-containing protein [Hyphomicrobiales bacterium]